MSLAIVSCFLKLATLRFGGSARQNGGKSGRTKFAAS
jgi:hypothetical protein